MRGGLTFAMGFVCALSLCPLTFLWFWVAPQKPTGAQSLRVRSNKPQLAKSAPFVRRLMSTEDMHLPSWFDPEYWEVPTIKTNLTFPDALMLDKEQFYLPERKDIKAMSHFFNGYRNGLLLEIGAADGWERSATKRMEHVFGWRSILVEASREAKKMITTRPNAIAIHAAACEEGRAFHFHWSALVELAFKESLNEFHKDLMKNNTLDQEKVNKLPLVHCLPIGKLLQEIGVKHINFFVLDCGGCELSVLKTFDFSKIRIDVIAVKTTMFPSRPQSNEAAKRRQAILDLMFKHPYEIVEMQDDTNTWFKRRGFVPSAATNIEGMKVNFFEKDVVGEMGHVLLPKSTPLVDSLLSSGKIYFPPWYDYSNWETPSVIGNATGDDTTLKNSRDYFGELNQDGEDSDAMKTYFKGYRNGLALELGALDGWSWSATKRLEKLFGWRSILVEANPHSARRMKARRPNAISINAAACDVTKEVHFASSGLVGTLVEFGSPQFLRSFHGNLMKNDTLDQEKVNRLPVVHCLPIGKVLEEIGVKHINFFVLDCEGCELSVLKTFDFGKIRIDVIAVETDRFGSTKEDIEYRQTVVDYMAKQPYDVAQLSAGRNTWFRHRDFTPSE